MSERPNRKPNPIDAKISAIMRRLYKRLLRIINSCSLAKRGA